MAAETLPPDWAKVVMSNHNNVTVFHMAGSYSRSGHTANIIQFTREPISTCRTGPGDILRTIGVVLAKSVNSRYEPALRFSLYFPTQSPKKEK